MNKHETILQSLAKIENVIYSKDYDELSDYLKGVRDMINMLNGEESSENVASYIIEQIGE